MAKFQWANSCAYWNSRLVKKKLKLFKKLLLLLNFSSQHVVGTEFLHPSYKQILSHQKDTLIASNSSSCPIDMRGLLWTVILNRKSMRMIWCVRISVDSFLPTYGAEDFRPAPKTSEGCTFLCTASVEESILFHIFWTLLRFLVLSHAANVVFSKLPKAQWPAYAGSQVGRRRRIWLAHSIFCVR